LHGAFSLDSLRIDKLMNREVCLIIWSYFAEHTSIDEPSEKGSTCQRQYQSSSIKFTQTGVNETSNRSKTG
jgi:hypothetical protein